MAAATPVQPMPADYAMPSATPDPMRPKPWSKQPFEQDLLLVPHSRVRLARHHAPRIAVSTAAQRKSRKRVDRPFSNPAVCGQVHRSSIRAKRPGRVDRQPPSQMLSVFAASFKRSFPHELPIPVPGNPKRLWGGSGLSVSAGPKPGHCPCRRIKPEPWPLSALSRASCSNLPRYAASPGAPRNAAPSRGPLAAPDRTRANARQHKPPDALARAAARHTTLLARVSLHRGMDGCTGNRSIGRTLVP